MADNKLSARFIDAVRNMTREERASFLLKFAAAFGRAFPRETDADGFKMPAKRRRKRTPKKGSPDAIGEL